ncbi:helix-turn-helix transcriptional regulator [Paraflavitalea sp. CAU 1676]|uniref:AraC family transcriptional regulator n=1 Tax=Paraflavitalea sp. CAU 1676 TaxID=3032598 RepID=UPI0023D9B200|nr:helix-turn-helix transcriptional regulator [Paraflavitalea sp. CAU 1676]MDF2191326.1 helix-turn-helix transcriptional regulator [Paraflavitalea sp. CAU 1676]
MPKQLQVKDKTESAETIKIVPFRKEIRKTVPHKHNNYFEIIYLSAGSGYHSIDSRKYPVIPPIIFFVRKEQVHNFDLEGEPDGFVAIIKKAFIDKSFDNVLKSLLTKLSSHNCLSIADNNTIHHLFELLCKENKIQNGGTFHIIEGLLKALFAKVLEVAKPFIKPDEIRSDLYQSFLELLNNGQVVKNSVQHYAELLNTTPQNLNAVCRKAVNQSATEVLAESLIGEARRLLHYTNSTVSEIAFTLDFTDASHFVKYYKRITGQTPQAYRKDCG